MHFGLRNDLSCKLRFRSGVRTCRPNGLFGPGSLLPMGRPPTPLAWPPWESGDLFVSMSSSLVVAVGPFESPLTGDLPDHQGYMSNLPFTTESIWRTIMAIDPCVKGFSYSTGVGNCRDHRVFGFLRLRR